MAALKFESREQLKTWLNKQPREVSVAIAARAALRILPLVVQAAPKRGGAKETATFLQLTASVFRAPALARVAAKYPTRANELRAADAGAYAAAAAGAYAAAAASAAYAADAAAAAAYAADAAASAAYAADAAAAGAYAADAAADARAAAFAAWEATTADAQFIEDGGAVAALADRKLWPIEAPPGIDDAWHKCAGLLSARNEGWGVWVQWYGDRILGRSQDEAREFVFALIPQELWDSEQGWIAANKWISEELEKLERKPPPSPSQWDFFISYGNKDEAMAREVADVLASAGHSTFAQFKDIPIGSNFVAEMQRGLAASGRVVALYSPHYAQSSHCQAEWNAAYNADPSGEKRKLVPFLLTPTELAPLARQVVYKSLVGLNAAQRRDAILSAIAPPRPVGDAAEIRSVLEEVASPQATLSPTGQIDAGPNKVFDKPFVDHDLSELPSIQRSLAKTINRSLPRNAPPVVRHALDDYAEHLLEKGAQPIVSLLTSYRKSLEVEFNSVEFEHWGAGLASLFEDFFRNDDLLRTHFPLKNEEVIAETPFDEGNATGGILDKTLEGVASAAQEAVDANIATKDFGKVADATARFAKDIDPLPPPQGALEPGTKRISVKKRFVLSTLGFLIGAYNIVGSTASIFTTPQGTALLTALKDAIDRLMTLIPL